MLRVRVLARNLPDRLTKNYFAGCTTRAIESTDDAITSLAAQA